MDKDPEYIFLKKKENIRKSNRCMKNAQPHYSLRKCKLKPNETYIA
jgi:hypothetical protein